MTPETAQALKEAAQQLEAWLILRDELVRQAAAEGGTLRQVGEAAGLSHTAVRNIVRGRF